jgi:hypothetical protein
VDTIIALYYIVATEMKIAHLNKSYFFLLK